MRTALCSFAALLAFGAIMALALLAELFRTDSIHPFNSEDET